MSLNQDSLGDIVAPRFHLKKDQRIPKCFKEVEKIIKSVKSCKQNYKTVLANSRLRGSVFKKVYSLTVNVLKNYNYIEKIIKKVQLLEKEKFLRKEIASVLIYELLFGRGILSGESKVVTILQSYEDEIRSAHEIFQNNLEDSVTFARNIPRYARVHTLVTTVPYVIQDLESYGFKQIFYDENLSEDKYLQLVQNLERGTFLVDFHFKDILVFESKENLVSLELYKNGHIVLQDKASYIPVHVLNPEPSSAVLDACAAPGMKTLHIASKMKNKGILIACERDKSRFESLKQMMEYGSVKICKMFCKDFKQINPEDQAYSVDYILLDPSCSGSGMVNRMDEVTDTEDSKNKERLTKLAGFQIILLKHALKFPTVKRVVYSTCSVHEEENEYVVQEALASCNQKYKLVPAMPEWSYRGSEDYSFGKLCLRTVPEKHLTNGFFVAVFERVDSNEYIGRQFSKKRKSQVDESDNFPDEIDSRFQKQNSSEITNEINEKYHKSNYSKGSECGYNMQQSRDFDENGQNYENDNQTMTDETELVNLNCFQSKRKKHKSKNKEKNLDEFSHSHNEIKLEESINIFSEQPLESLKQEDYEEILHSKTENYRSDVKSKKHKQIKMDGTYRSVEITKKELDIASSVKKLQCCENREISPITTSNSLNEDTEINSNENFECQQKRKKKHKKNRIEENSDKCSKPEGNESISATEIENNRMDDSINKEKLKLFSGENVQISLESPSCKKKKKKHSLSIEMNSSTASGAPNDWIEKCNKNSANYSINAQEPEYSNYAQKKKRKENNANVSLEPQICSKLEYEGSTSPSEKANLKNDFTIKEMSPLYKTKKVKIKEAYSLETQTQFSNDLDSSAQGSKKDLEIECSGSTENIPVKKKKHKKHSKNLNFDACKDFSISIDDSGSFSQLSEVASHKHGKKKKHKHSDKNRNSNDVMQTKAPELSSPTYDMVVSSNSPFISNDSGTIHESKHHKKKEA